jgi:hypothetical protein
VHTHQPGPPPKITISRFDLEYSSQRNFKHDRASFDFILTKNGLNMLFDNCTYSSKAAQFVIEHARFMAVFKRHNGEIKIKWLSNGFSHKTLLRLQAALELLTSQAINATTELAGSANRALSTG